MLLHLVLLYNLQFTAWPEMFSFPYLKNNGYLLYRDMVHAYPPLLTLLLATIYKIFGYQLAVVKIFTWIGILINDVLVYLIIKKLTKSSILGSLFMGIYIIIQPVLEGNMLWYDTAIVTPILIGTYFGIKTLAKNQKQDLVLAGLFFTLASLIKQTGAFFYLGFLIIYFLKFKKLNQIKFYFLPAVILWGVLLIRLWTENAVMGFVNSVFINPSQYWVNFPGYVDLDLNNYEIRIILLLLLPVLGFLKLLRKNENNLLIGIFLALSIVAVYPRFSFFHFQTALVFIIIIWAILIKESGFKYLFPVFLAAFGILYFSRYQFNLNRNVRFFEPRQLELAEHIKNTVGVDQKVYLFGLHSNLYVLSGRLPPKPWSDNFGWHYQVPDFEDGVLTGWSVNPPEYVYKYTLDTFYPMKITKWIESNYNKQELVFDNVEIWKIKN